MSKTFATNSTSDYSWLQFIGGPDKKRRSWSKRRLREFLVGSFREVSCFQKSVRGAFAQQCRVRVS